MSCRYRQAIQEKSQMDRQTIRDVFERPGANMTKLCHDSSLTVYTDAVDDDDAMKHYDAVTDIVPYILTPPVTSCSGRYAMTFALMDSNTRCCTWVMLLCQGTDVVHACTTCHDVAREWCWGAVNDNDSDEFDRVIVSRYVSRYALMQLKI